ncbi:hypothetical protein J4226_04775 [Candidatus Pacearchaeota archaeon]|nr:hypothetical protein [Candidatus Pacearchaeota archaeon]
MEKRGEVVSDSAIELIIAVAVVAVLIIFAVSFYGLYDEADKISEGYLKVIEEGVGIADKGGVGEVIMFDRGDKDMKFYLVYFGSVASFGDVEGEEYFKNKKIGDNVICVCYWDGEDEQNYCRECLDLSMSARSIVGSVHSIDASDLSSGTWEIVEGGRVEIWKDGGGYVFSTK